MSHPSEPTDPLPPASAPAPPTGRTPAGPPPPGAPPPDEAGRAEPGRTNRFAIASLVVGLVAPCGLWVLSLVLGIVGLIQIRRRGEKGNGLAVGGLAATGVWILALVVGVAILVGTNIASEPGRDGSGQITEEGDLSTFDVAAGDCLNDLAEGVQLEVSAVPCAEPHDAEVFATTDLADGAWPGMDAVVRDAESGCVDRLAGDFPAAYDDPHVGLYYLHPTESSWRNGDREVVCVVEYLAGPRTGSLLD